MAESVNFCVKIQGECKGLEVSRLCLSLCLHGLSTKEENLGLRYPLPRVQFQSWVAFCRAAAFYSSCGCDNLVLERILITFGMRENEIFCVTVLQILKAVGFENLMLRYGLLELVVSLQWRLQGPTLQETERCCFNGIEMEIVVEGDSFSLRGVCAAHKVVSETVQFSDHCCI